MLQPRTTDRGEGRSSPREDHFGTELQHRVRNNLQLIYSMLSKQIQVTTDSGKTQGFSAIARRVLTLAEVYEHLLGTGLNREVDFGRHLRSLCSSPESLEQANMPDVNLKCDCEPVNLDLDTVTALCLVISELVTNSYAHAFCDGQGSISVSLSADQSGKNGSIVFSDDGAGFIDTSDNKRNGLRLVKRLMEQIGGSATLLSDHGSKWTLRFPVRPMSGASGLSP
jgi:two-component sensor histidine kinase